MRQAAESLATSAPQMPFIESLWKYTALGASSIITEEANPILGGIAARHGRLDLGLVIIAVTLGTWAASLGLYWLGRTHIEWVRARFPKKAALLDTALSIVERNPWRATLAIRFAYWIRIPLPVACGAARVPLPLYTIASGISCLVWSVAFTALGYWASGAALRALAFTKRGDVQLVIVAVVVVGGIVGWWLRRRMKRKAASISAVAVE